ncbi:hypothetical protein ACNKHQ_21220 [Shigella flexneri]
MPNRVNQTDLSPEKSGKVLPIHDVRVLDHLVIGRGEYVSLPNEAGFSGESRDSTGFFVVRDLSISSCQRILRHL